jgi:hypothetical protein
MNAWSDLKDANYIAMDPSVQPFHSTRLAMIEELHEN